MDPDPTPISPLTSEPFRYILLLSLAIFLLDLWIVLIRAAIKNVKFSEDYLEDSNVDRTATISFFSATAKNLSILNFAVSFFHVLTGVMALIPILVLASSALSDWGAVVIGILIPFALLFFSGIVNGVGKRFANQWAAALLRPAYFFVAIFRPLYEWYESFSLKPGGSHMTFDQIESNLIEWVEKAPSRSKLKEEERKMVRSILHFSDTLIREIMIPRIDLTAIEVNTGLAEAAEAILASGHSRLPVYDDEIDNITGILYAKDLIKYYSEEHSEPFSLKSILREPVFVPESKKAGDLLSDMQLDGIHMVIVVDEYGGTAGIVSMEDIVEEIVGEIRDEYDDAEEIPVETLSPDEFSFLGRVDIVDINDTLGTHIPRDSADTIAGLMYMMIGKIPEGDERVEIEGWVFSIAELTGNRIRRVRAERKKEDPEAETGPKEEPESGA